MNLFAKATVAAVAGLASVFVPIANASAGDRYYDEDGFVIQRHVAPRHAVRRHHNDDAFLAGVLGLAAGAIIVGAITQPRAPAYRPQPVYRPAPAYDAYPDAPPAPRRPHVINYDDGVEPWTRDWYRYCSDRYRSFNPETGTYRGYDGRNHFCAAN
jgi:BA14K-like protein